MLIHGFFIGIKHVYIVAIVAKEAITPLDRLYFLTTMAAQPRARTQQSKVPK